MVKPVEKQNEPSVYLTISHGTKNLFSNDWQTQEECEYFKLGVPKASFKCKKTKAMFQILTISHKTSDCDVRV